MTNELGTTLQDIEAKAERKREALESMDTLQKTLFAFMRENERQDILPFVKKDIKTIRKYIEEN